MTAFVQPGTWRWPPRLPPPLTPARLKVAAAGAVELLALGDADALLVAHGARAADGNVCLAWIAREQAERAQALMEGCGLTAAALAPLPLWLPRTPDGWTLMQGDDWVALRAGSDHVEIHAIARADVPSGDVPARIQAPWTPWAGMPPALTNRAWARREPTSPVCRPFARAGDRQTGADRLDRRDSALVAP